MKLHSLPPSKEPVLTQAQSKDPTQAVIRLTSGTNVLARSGTLVWMPGNIKVSFHLATAKVYEWAVVCDRNLNDSSRLKNS